MSETASTELNQLCPTCGKGRLEQLVSDGIDVCRCPKCGAIFPDRVAWRSEEQERC